MAANMVPEGKPTAELMQKLDTEDQAPKEPKLTEDQWQELLIQALEKRGTLEWLKYWPPELAKKAKQLLEFHKIFSLESNEIGCTDTIEHIIELTDDNLFKEQFHRIAPPLVEEVHQNLQDIPGCHSAIAVSLV